MSLNSSPRLLHQHLTRLRDSTADRFKVREVLATVFSVSANDDMTLRHALVLLDQLFIDTEEQLRTLPKVDADRYLRHFPQLRRGLANLPFDSPSPSAITFITDSALENLDLAAARVAEERPEKEVPQQEIADLEAQIRDVFEFIDRAKLEPRLKEVAFDLLETLRQAIVEYRIRGVEGLQKAIEAALGKLALYYKQQGGKVSVEVFSRLWSLVVRTEAVASKVLTYGPFLSDSFQRFLGPG